MSEMSNTEEREDTACIEITCSVKGQQECNFTVDVGEEFSYKFLAYYVDFDLKKKIVLLIVLLFLASMLTKLSSTDIIAVTLATALLVSTSLLATLENLERVMAAARSLLLIIILILNTTACVAVVEMVRFFSVEKHFLLTVTVP